MIQTSIIIVAYRDMKSVSTCIASLPSDSTIEILVIDNTNHNRGFGAACNLGARFAQGKNLLFLNPDCEYRQGNINQWLNQFENKTLIGILGAQLLSKHDKPYLSYSQQPTAQSAPIIYSILNNWLRHTSLVQRHWFHHHVSHQALDVGIVSGAAIAISKTLFNQIGGFDERFFLYWEEVDLCRRVLAEHYRVVYDPSVKFVHIGETSTSTVKSTAFNLFKESRYKFFSKYFGPLYGIVLETMLTITEEWRLILGLIFLFVLSLGYYGLGWWLSWRIIPTLWYWLGIAGVAAYIMIAKETWPLIHRWQKLLIVSAGIAMFITAPFQWLISLVCSSVWSVSDLVNTLHPLRKPLVMMWVAATIIASLILIPQTPLPLSTHTLYQWHHVVHIIRIPYTTKPTFTCYGCTPTDQHMLEMMLPPAKSLTTSQVRVAVPPFSNFQYIDKITTKVGDILIIWPLQNH